jgi:hypothetical protein
MGYMHHLSLLTMLAAGCAEPTDTDLEDTDTDTDVEAENSQPIAVDDVAEAIAGQYTEVQVRENDSDPDRDALSISEVTQGEFGLVEIVTGEKRVGYTPLDDDFVGTDEFTYTVHDGRGGAATATVTMTVFEQPTLVITSPTSGDTVTSPVEITFEVVGCNVSYPNADSDGCHVHMYLDGYGYQETPNSIGHYEPGPISIEASAGNHRFTLELIKNDGSDAPMEPLIDDEITFTVEAP